MVGPVDPTSTVVAQVGRWFRLAVEWIRMCELPGFAVDHIVNGYANNSQVTKSKDCVEVSPDAGEELLEFIYRMPEQV